MEGVVWGVSCVEGVVYGGSCVCRELRVEGVVWREFYGE